MRQRREQAVKMVECKKYTLKLLRVVESNTDTNELPPTRLEILFNQLLDSAILGGISGISSYVAAGQSAGVLGFAIAFATTFLVKMKEYRKIV